MPEPTQPPTPLPAPPPPAPFQVRLPGGHGPATWSAGPPLAAGPVPPLGGLPVAGPAAAPRPAPVVATNPRPTRRRHAARRSRIAAVVASSVAFVGLVGCTALTSPDKSADSVPADQAPANQNPASDRIPSAAGDGSSDQVSDFPVDRGGPADSYGTGRRDRVPQADPYGQSTWGSPSSGSAVPGAGSGATQTAPRTQTQGS